MASMQMDGVSSFVYLTDNVPTWLTQLTELNKYAAQKNSEFVAEYTQLVDNIKPKRRRAASVESIRSDEAKSTRVPSLPAPPNPVDIDPLEAGNKYLYAQAQRKRKPTSSVRSGASGPQKFRSKNQVIIYYDSHVQTELESLVKAIGLARNNLRKGRNAHNASSGFPLPNLGRKHDLSFSLSFDDLRPNAISETVPPLPGSKCGLRPSSPKTSDGDDALFTSADKILESTKDLYETAAHQFLRDGDCKSELDTAISQLNAIFIEAKQSAEILGPKAEKQNNESLPTLSDSVDTASDISLQPRPFALDPLQILNNKQSPMSLSQTLDDIDNRATVSPPAMGDLSNLPTAGVEIEVDDDSDDDSFGKIDMSQFRAANRTPWRYRAGQKEPLREPSREQLTSWP